MRWFRRRRKSGVQDDPKIVHVAVGTMQTPEITVTATVSSPTFSGTVSLPVIPVTVGVTVIDDEQTGRLK